jgi:hypothetical protein
MTGEESFMVDEQKIPGLDALDGGDIGLSPERLALLAPKLRTLIEGFRVLETLETDESEPGISPWRFGEDAHVQ